MSKIDSVHVAASVVVMNNSWYNLFIIYFRKYEAKEGYNEICLVAECTASQINFNLGQLSNKKKRELKQS